MNNKDFRNMNYSEKYDLIKHLMYFSYSDDKYGKILYFYYNRKRLKEELIRDVFFCFINYINDAPNKPNFLSADKENFLQPIENEWKIYWERKDKYEMLSSNIVNEILKLIDDIGNDFNGIDNDILNLYHVNDEDKKLNLLFYDEIKNLKNMIDESKFNGFCISKKNKIKIYDY